MNSKDLIRQTIGATDTVWKGYLADLTDAELLHRPVKGANHINWQFGHLIVSEHMLGNSIEPDAMPPLPDGLAEKYAKDTATNDDASAFETKESLMSIQETQRAGLMKILDGLSEEDLDKPTSGPMQGFFPNFASLIMSADVHWMMHAGQWALTRRSLGKPPLF
tara:strand:+ start:203829 stop:204320 length:492 start_codon:yes stop_codon:yes gene_type:complete